MSCWPPFSPGSLFLLQSLVLQLRPRSLRVLRLSDVGPTHSQCHSACRCTTLCLWLAGEVCLTKKEFGWWREVLSSALQNGQCALLLAIILELKQLATETCNEQTVVNVPSHYAIQNIKHSTCEHRVHNKTATEKFNNVFKRNITFQRNIHNNLLAAWTIDTKSNIVSLHPKHQNTKTLTPCNPTVSPNGTIASTHYLSEGILVIRLTKKYKTNSQ